MTAAALEAVTAIVRLPEDGATKKKEPSPLEKRIGLVADVITQNTTLVPGASRIVAEYAVPGGPLESAYLQLTGLAIASGKFSDAENAPIIPLSFKFCNSHLNEMYFLRSLKEGGNLSDYIPYLDGVHFYLEFFHRVNSMQIRYNTVINAATPVRRFDEFLLKLPANFQEESREGDYIFKSKVFDNLLNINQFIKMREKTLSIAINYAPIVDQKDQKDQKTAGSA